MAENIQQYTRRTVLDTPFESVTANNNPEELHKNLLTEDELKKGWSAFFLDLRGKANKIVEGSINKYENPESAVNDLMDAIKSLYIEITIEDQIKAIINGVDKAVKLAHKKTAKVLLLEGVGDSDSLLAKSAKIELKKVAKKYGVDFIVTDEFTWDRTTSDDNVVFLAIDDGAYSGVQKNHSVETLKKTYPNADIVLSLGACSNHAKEKFEKFNHVHLLFQKEISDLATELNRKGNEEAYRLATKLFRSYTRRGVLSKKLVGAYTTFKIPDNRSIPEELRPNFFDEGRLYPDSI